MQTIQERPQGDLRAQKEKPQPRYSLTLAPCDLCYCQNEKKNTKKQKKKEIVANIQEKKRQK